MRDSVRDERWLKAEYLYHAAPIALGLAGPWNLFLGFRFELSYM